MTVNEAAAQLNVSARRIRAMIADGRIRAHRSGPAWVIEELSPSKERRSLSPRSWGLLSQALKSRSLAGLTGHDRARIALRIRQLRESDHPARLIADWRPSPSPRDPFMDSLADHAARDGDSYVRTALRRRPEYLRDPRDLAQLVMSERVIRGESRGRLAEASGVSDAIIDDIESCRALSSPGQVRKVLGVLGVEPTALPDMVLS